MDSSCKSHKRVPKKKKKMPNADAGFFSPIQTYPKSQNLFIYLFIFAHE